MLFWISRIDVYTFHIPWAIDFSYNRRMVLEIYAADKKKIQSSNSLPRTYSFFSYFYWWNIHTKVFYFVMDKPLLQTWHSDIVVVFIFLKKNSNLPIICIYICKYMWIIIVIIIYTVAMYIKLRCSFNCSSS